MSDSYVFIERTSGCVGTEVAFTIGGRNINWAIKLSKKNVLSKC